MHQVINWWAHQIGDAPKKSKRVERISCHIDPSDWKGIRAIEREIFQVY